jgi:F-type H+-transporting ATPase subunit b
VLVRFSIWIVTLLLVLGTTSLSVADDNAAKDNAAKDTEAGDPKAANVKASKEEAHKTPEGDHPHAKKDGDPDHKDDDYDNSHKDATGQLGAAQEISWGLATYTFIVFIGLVAVLSAFAWKPIMGALDEREKSMDGKIAEAKQMFAEAETKLAEYKQQIANAQKEIQQSREQVMRDADEKRQQIINDAQAAGKAERDRAVLEIDAAKSQAISELTQQSVNLAVDLAGKIVKKQLTADDHAQLINEAIRQLPSRN